LTARENLAQESDKSQSKSDRLIKWRREQVWEYRSMGLSINEIVEILKNKPEIKISHGTVHNDLKVKQAEIQENFKGYIENELPMQHSLAVTGLDRVIKEAWRIYTKADDQKAALAALNVISDATMKKQAVLGDPAQIEKAIKLVSKLRANLSNNIEGGKEQKGSTEQLEEELGP
jgi:hypothetical protein